MALTITSEVVNDWTLVAQNAIDISEDFDISGNYDTKVFIQGFNTSETAHIGTEYKLQVTPSAEGDEDWHDIMWFPENVISANAEAILDDPLHVGDTVILLASTTGFSVNNLLASSCLCAIKDSVDANCEVIQQTDLTTDTNITIANGVKNDHAVGTIVYNFAFSKSPISIPMGSGLRARLYVNNKMDSDGSSIAYKITITKTTKV